MSYKNIRIPKRGGGTRLQRVQVLKSGKFKFVKNLKKKVSRSKKTKTKTSRRKKTIAKNKRRNSRKFTLPLGPVLGLAAGLVAPAVAAMEGDISKAVRIATLNYTGYDTVNQTFFLDGLKRGLAPLLVGLLVHKFVGGAPLNANRMLAAANVPVLRI